MDASTVHIVTLDQKPCVVQYLEQYNKFIVGTYELFPSLEEAKLRLVHHPSLIHLNDQQLAKTLEKINFRAGKLILLRGNDISAPSIEYNFDCQAGGGVFDIKLKYNKVDSSYNIYVAHSNGTIGIYKLALHCGNKICLKEHLSVAGSKMLTCIDTFPDSSTSSSPKQNQRGLTLTCNNSSTNYQRVESIASNYRLVVGDSGGFVTVLPYAQAIEPQAPIRENVTGGDSIWQVKTLELASENNIIIVGAENSSWYIYGFDREAERLLLLYKNSFKDFSAGVTCISVLDIMHSIEYDLVEILLGSYDETLQAYQLKINHDGISKPGVCHKNTISIENGGIWRIKPFKGNNKRQWCVAAMYAGSYILNLDGENIKPVASIDQQIPNENTSLSRIIDTESLELAHKPLHYDIDISSCNKTYCIVDFNNSLCLFKTID